MSLGITVTLGASLDTNDTEEIILNVLNSLPSTNSNHIKYCKVCVKNIVIDTTNLEIASITPDPIPNVCLTKTQLDDINNGITVHIRLGAITTGSVNEDGTLENASTENAIVTAIVESSIYECKVQSNTSLSIDDSIIVVEPE